MLAVSRETSATYTSDNKSCHVLQSGMPTIDRQQIIQILVFAVAVHVTVTVHNYS